MISWYLRVIFTQNRIAVILPDDVRELYNLTDIRTGEMKQKQFRTENQQGTAEAEGYMGKLGAAPKADLI